MQGYAIIIIFFILAGIAAVIYNGRNIAKSNKSKDWPQTNATITHKTANNPSGAPDIFFSYTVSDSLLEKQIHPAPGEETMPGFAKHFTTKYPDGESITVYYDPADSENTLFAVGAGAEDKWMFGLGIGAILMGLYALTVAA